MGIPSKMCLNNLPVSHSSSLLSWSHCVPSWSFHSTSNWGQIQKIGLSLGEQAHEWLNKNNMRWEVLPFVNVLFKRRFFSHCISIPWRMHPFFWKMYICFTYKILYLQSWLSKHNMDKQCQYVPGDGIKRDPDMDWIGRLGSNGQHGTIFPFLVTFNAVTRYRWLVLESDSFAWKVQVHPTESGNSHIRRVYARFSLQCA